jgi:hypothetical protein
LPRTAAEPNETAVDRNVHGTTVDRLKAAYGTPPVDTSANFPIVSEKIVMYARGWITAQATPRSACLYFTRTSRSAYAQIEARNNHTSRRDDKR